MLTARENFIETLKADGKPDRLVNQYEFMKTVFTPVFKHRDQPKKGELNKVNAWGVTVSWGDDQPGAFPVHTPDKIVCPDVEDWKNTVKAPSLAYPEAEWDEFLAECESIDRTQQFIAPMHAPGIFEMCHYLMGFENALMAFYESPEDMKDMVKYIAEWELKVAEVTCEKLHPDMLFHHDDWGTQISTFADPDMFRDFFEEPYKMVYSYYKDHGVQYIVHHSDSYAETLVPMMLEVGIDVWQGAMETNNINKIIEDNLGKLTIMGGINSALVDKADWTPELIKDVVIDRIDKYGNNGHGYIPCLTQGGAASTFPGVYDEASKVIAEYSPTYFSKHGLA